MTPKTQLGLFVVHNKCVPTTRAFQRYLGGLNDGFLFHFDRLKPKREDIPEGTPYFAGEHIEDHWV